MENLKSIDKRFGQPIHSFTTFNQSTDKLYLNPKVSPVNALSSPISYQNSSPQRDRRSEPYGSARYGDLSDNRYHHRQLHSTDSNGNCPMKDVNSISKSKQIRIDNYNSNKCIQRGKQFDTDRKVFIASSFNESKATATKFPNKTEKKEDNHSKRDSSRTARYELDNVEPNLNSHKPYPMTSSKLLPATYSNNENHKITRQRQYQRVSSQSRNPSQMNDTKTDISKTEQISNSSKPYDIRARVRCGNMDEVSNRGRTHNTNLHGRKLDNAVAQASCWTPTYDKKNIKGAPTKLYQKTGSTTSKTSMSAILKEKCELLMSKNNLLPRSNSLDGTKDSVVLVDCKKPSQSIESLHQMSRSEFSVGFRKESSDQNPSKFVSSESLQNSELRLPRKVNDNNCTVKRVVKFAPDRSSMSHIPLKKSQSVDSQLDYSDSSHYCYDSSRSCKDEEFLESKEPSNPKRMTNNYGVKLSTLSSKTLNINGTKSTGRNDLMENYNRMLENDCDDIFIPDKLHDSEMNERLEHLQIESQSTPWYQETADLSYYLPSNKRSDTYVNNNINQSHSRKTYKKTTVDNSGNKLTAVDGATINQSQNSDDYHDSSSVCTKDLGHDSGIDSSASYPQRFVAYYLNPDSNATHVRDSFREFTSKGKNDFVGHDDVHRAQSITCIEKSRKWIGKDCTGVSDDCAGFKTSNVQFDDASSNASTITISDKVISHNSNQEFCPIKNRENSFDSLTRYSKASASTSGSRSSRKRVSYSFANKMEQKSTTGSNSGGSSSTEGRVIGSSIRRDRRRSSKNQLAYITVDEKSKKAANRSSVRTTLPESTTNKSKRKGKGMLSNTCKVS